MRLLVSWLRDFVDVTASVEEIAEGLALRGFEVASVDPAQFVFVQPRFARAVDKVAVIEHETGAIGVPEIFKAGNLHLVSWLAFV